MAETDVKIKLEDLNATRPAAADFNKLKAELAKELYRRSGNGSVYGQYEKVNAIPDLATGQKATADQWNATIGFLYKFTADNGAEDIQNGEHRTEKSIDPNEHHFHNYESGSELYGAANRINKLAAQNQETQKNVSSPSGTDIGCGANCTGLCSGSCYGGCNSGCTKNCATGCGGGCTGCSGGNWGTKGYSSGTTSSTCGGCGNYSCGMSCGISCTNKCESTCTYNCAGNTYSVGGDSEECAACSSGCHGGCSNSCIDGCKGSCGKNCTGKCTNGCNTECSTGCSNDCGSGCSEGCSGNCTSSCGTNCTSNCGNGCSSGCTGGCGSTCAHTTK